MRSTKNILIGALTLCGLSGNAAAAELTGAEIKDLVAGKSVYLEFTAASAAGVVGTGIIFYAPDGTALYKTVKGAMWHGTWTIKGNTNCHEWKEAPNNPCVKYDKQGDTISVLNSATGEVRGKILKTAAGNAEKLAP